jgi:spermidine synthase
MPSQSTQSHSQDSWFRFFLLLTAALCGAIVMVVEVLGSRVIGPFFGVSLFVWTSLITVTLVALALGYAVGGRLSDRPNAATLLYSLVLAAGVCVLAVPLAQAFVLKACVGLGLRFGSLLASAILFGPSLFLLGCVSPFFVRLLALEMSSLGRTVGGLYALSTAGSFIGTVATGFFLIGVISVSRIFLLAGALLCMLATVYFLAFRRKRVTAVAALILPAALLLVPMDVLPTKTMADGTKVAVIEKRDSFYGNLRVVDYRFGEKHLREMAIDGLIQGGVDVVSGLSVYEYPYVMQFLPRALHPAGQSSLVIGLGAGIIPRWYAAQGIQTEVVDIDPEVLRLAHQYFDFSRQIPVHIEDARRFLSMTEKKYDYILLDVFNGDTTPGHLLSVEAMHLMRQRLSPEGVLSINLMGSLQRENLMTASVVRTLKAVFDQVQIHSFSQNGDQDASGNLVLVAYQGLARPIQSNSYAGQPIHPMAIQGVERAMQNRFDFPVDTPAIILTDDFNPIDLRDLWMKEEVRRNILNTTDHDILLG